MAYYDGVIEALGLRDWCGGPSGGPMTMAELLARRNGDTAPTPSFQELPFPSLDELHRACDAIPRTRDMTSALERGFLDIRDALRFVLDPLTQPLSWLIDWALWAFLSVPWFILIPAFIALSYWVTRNLRVTAFVAGTFLFFAAIDHYDYAMQTLSIIFVCTLISVIIGLPIGIAMAKSNRLQAMFTPVLDMMQTLPTFVYLIPLIFLFSVTESKLYGIAIILYAIVPVIRLTNLGIRLVDKEVVEAANAFGMNPRQKLFGVEVPLALPNIMAGVNQTIMMALAMVVIASLVSAPGLGVLVLRGIRSLELGVGLVAGICIVLLAVVLDRVSKASLARVNVTSGGH